MPLRVFVHLQQRIFLTTQIDEHTDRMHEQMRVMRQWTVGTIALFGTIVTVLPTIAGFPP
jgi:hypothetical protein